MDRVLIQYKNLEIILDQHIDYRVVGGRSHGTHYVRARVMFKSVDDLYFRLSCQSLMDDMGKLFGVQDIVLGHKKMDSNFLVKGNDEYKVQQILSTEKIAPFLLSQQNPPLEIKKDKGMFEEPMEPGFAMLYFLTKTKFNERKQLEELLEFMFT